MRRPKGGALTKYDCIGGTYNNTRVADDRIVDVFVRLLGLHDGASIAEIGAGNGSYAAALAGRGYRVKAVECDEQICRQAVPSPFIEWLPGRAEQVPLDDESVSGVFSVLAIHHFEDQERAFDEMTRISPFGPIVILTFDPRLGQETWITDYFATIWANAFKVFPPIHDVAGLLEKATGREVEAVPLLLPHDLRDNFAAAGWRNPHRYLSAAFRENIRAFRLADQAAITREIVRLSADLVDGTWERRYGQVLQLDEIDAGYRFLRVFPA